MINHDYFFKITNADLDEIVDEVYNCWDEWKDADFGSVYNNEKAIALLVFLFIPKEKRFKAWTRNELKNEIKNMINGMDQEIEE